MNDNLAMRLYDNDYLVVPNQHRNKNVALKSDVDIDYK